MIQEINSWMGIPKNPTIPSFEETDRLLREMKPILARYMRIPKYAEDKWWYWSIFVKLDYRYIGEWFFDSLIAVNTILWEEDRSYGIPTLYGSRFRYGANRLARIVPSCYRYPNGNYSYSTYASFYRDEDKEFVLEHNDIAEMIEYGWWPSIVHEFGLLPTRYEKGENDD